MKRPRLPHPNSRSYALLQALVVRPGTFYQVVERAGFDIEATGMEQRLRLIFTHGIQHHVRLDGIMYEIKEASRGAMPVLVVRRGSKTDYSPLQQPT